MVAQKRTLPSDEARPAKKFKAEDAATKHTAKPSSSAPRAVFSSALVADETEFPRGGGTTLTPIEYKKVRDEGRKEAEQDAEAVSLSQACGIAAHPLIDLAHCLKCISDKQEKRKRKQLSDRKKKAKSAQDTKSTEPRKDKDAIRECLLLDRGVLIFNRSPWPIFCRGGASKLQAVTDRSKAPRKSSFHPPITSHPVPTQSTISSRTYHRSVRYPDQSTDEGRNQLRHLHGRTRRRIR